MDIFSIATRELLEDERTFESNVYVDLLKQRGAELERELMAIRSRQNDYALPNRLPAEVLEKIFIELASDVYWDWEEDNRLRWIRVAHVCRHWRDVAINYAPLWSELVVARPEFLKLMLARSKGAPLRFTLNTDRLGHLKYDHARLMRDGLIEALAHTERFLLLDILISRGGKTQLKDLLSKATGRAPNLRELKLCNAASPSTAIPSDFLQGGAPALTRLELQHIHIPWSQMPLPATLTQLELCNGGPRPPFAEFYESLSKLDALKRLTLVKWLPESGYSQVPLPTPSPLVLKALRFIEVEDSTARINDFFNVVRTPQANTTYITLDDRRPGGPAIDSCLEKIRNTLDEAIRKYSKLVQLVVRDLDSGDNIGDPLFQLWFHPLPDEDESDSEGEAHPSIAIQFGKQSIPLIAVLASFNKHFDFSHVTAVDLVRCPDMPPTVFLQAFSRLPKLIHLAFSSTPFYEMFQAFAADPALQPRRKGDTTARPTPYFPALYSIMLTSVNFNEGGRVADDTMEPIIRAINKRPSPYIVEEFRLETCRNFGATEFRTLTDRVRPITKIFWDKEEDWSEMDLEGSGDSVTHSD